LIPLQTLPVLAKLVLKVAATTLVHALTIVLGIGVTINVGITTKHTTMKIKQMWEQ